MKEHTIIYGEGAQDLRTYLVDENGEATRPTSVTGEIVDLLYDADDASTDRVVLAATAATLDSFSATTTAAAGTGQTDRSRIVVDDETGVVEGRTYVITSTTGLKREFTVDHIDAANNTIYASEDLRGPFPVGSTVQGVEFTLEFPAAEANDIARFEDGGPYAVKWTAVGVTPSRSRELIWVKRHEASVYGSVEDVLIVDQALDSLTGRRLKIERALVLANRDFRREARRRGTDPESYLAGDIGRDYIGYRAAAIVRRQMGSGSNTEILAEDYDRRAEQVLLALTSQGTVTTSRVGDRATEEPTSLHTPVFRPT